MFIKYIFFIDILINIYYFYEPLGFPLQRTIFLLLILFIIYNINFKIFYITKYLKYIKK